MAILSEHLIIRTLGIIDLCEERKTGSKLCQNRFSQNFWIFLHKESHIQANFKLFRENLPSKFHLNERGQEIAIFHLAGSFRVCSNLVCDLMKLFYPGLTLFDACGWRPQGSTINRFNAPNRQRLHFNMSERQNVNSETHPELSVTPLRVHILTTSPLARGD